jgi:hypothetical protein
MRVYATLAAAMALVLALAGSAKADPLNLKHVAADAKWVAHVDWDALQASKVFQDIREDLLKAHPGAERHLAELREHWKFDPRHDLHGITLYGEQLKSEGQTVGTKGVAIVHAKLDQQFLLERAKQAPGHEVTAHGKYEMHTWLQGGRRSEHERTVTGAFYAPDTLLFGSSKEEVAAALDVLDGTKPSLAGKDSPLAAAAPQGAVFVARVIGLTEAKLPAECPLAHKVNALVLAIGEYQRNAFVQGKLVVDRPETAEQIKSVVQGGLALAAMSHADDAEAQKLIDAVKITTSGNTVSAGWQAAVEAAAAQMKKEIARKAAHERRHRHGPHPCAPPESDK